MYLAWARCNYNVHAHGFVLFSAGGATYSKTSFKKFRRAKLWDPMLLHAIKHHSLQLTERLKGGPRENLHTPMKRKYGTGDFTPSSFTLLFCLVRWSEIRTSSKKASVREVFTIPVTRSLWVSWFETEVMFLKRPRRQVIRVRERYMTRAILRSQQDDSYKWRLACS